MNCDKEKVEFRFIGFALAQPRSGLLEAEVVWHIDPLREKPKLACLQSQGVSDCQNVLS